MGRVLGHCQADIGSKTHYERPFVHDRWTAELVKQDGDRLHAKHPGDGGWLISPKKLL